MSIKPVTVFPWFVVVGVLLAALSMRGPILSPTPVMKLVTDEYGLDAATAGLVTTAPVLMFVLMTPVAALIVRKAGAERALMLTMLGVLAGAMVRMLDGFGWLLVGSAIIGASIMIGNITVPVIIRRDVPVSRVATVTAAYTAMMNVGSLLVSMGTAPLANLMGWQWAVCSWTLLILVAIVVWSRQVARARKTAVAEPVGAQTDAIAAVTGPIPHIESTRTLRQAVMRPAPLLLMLAFAVQCFMYYGLSTWLPTITADLLHTDLASAGAFAAIFQGVGIAGAFLAPLLNRWFAPAVVAAAISVCWLAVPLGLFFAPTWIAVWLTFGGIAQAGGFVVVIATMVSVARSDAEAASMSAVIQGCGYLVAAVAAPVLGGLHDATGGWMVPLAVVTATATCYVIALISAVTAARKA